MFGLGLDAAHQDHREVVVDVALGLIRATTEAFRVPAHHAIGEFLSDMPRRASLAHIEASIPRRTPRPLGGPTNDDFGPGRTSPHLPGRKTPEITVFRAVRLARAILVRGLVWRGGRSRARSAGFGGVFAGFGEVFA